MDINKKYKTINTYNETTVYKNNEDIKVIEIKRDNNVYSVSLSEQMRLVLKGDTFDALRCIGDKSIDLIIIDPPYGTTDCDWDVTPNWSELFTEYNRVIKDNGAILVFAQQPVATDIITANRKFFRYEIVWEKDNALGFLNARKMPLRAHELILVFYKHRPTYNPQMSEGKPYKTKQRSAGQVYKEKKILVETVNEGTRYPRDVIRGFKQERGLHPTQKPVSLLKWLIETYSKPGEVVLDTFAGSGSTGVAAIETDRSYILVEKDETYYETIIKRIDESYEDIYNTKIKERCYNEEK